MMKLKLTVDDEAAFIELLKHTGAKTSGGLFNIALNFLHWGIEQEKQGQTIAAVSGDEICSTLNFLDDRRTLMKGESEDDD